MHSLLNRAFISWENSFNAELRKKVNGTDIIFYDTKSLFKFMYEERWTHTDIQCHNRHSLPAT
jgi:hypothetical protein